METLKNTHIVYGFIIAIIMIIINVILYMTGMAFNPDMQYINYLSYVPYLIGIILNGIAFSKINDGNVSFGNVFGSCFKACAIVTIVLLVWSFVSFAVFPDLKEKGLEMVHQSMLKRNMSDEQIDSAMEMTRKSFKVFMIAGIIFGTMFWGALFSLLGAAFARKKGNIPTVQ